MDELISQYLFQNSKCPLPGIGTLYLSEKAARLNNADHLLSAPVSVAHFSVDAGDPTPLIRFISGMQKTDVATAGKRLEAYCRQLSSLRDQQEWVIAGAGRFLSDAEGVVSFEPETLPDHFMPDVPVKRVIRNDAAHSITVGDKETDNHMMTEILKGKSKVSKFSKGEIAVFFILVFSLALIAYYFKTGDDVALFGNKAPVVIKKEPAQYLEK
jgi:hypothetical protein